MSTYPEHNLSEFKKFDFQDLLRFNRRQKYALEQLRRHLVNAMAVPTQISRYLMREEPERCVRLLLEQCNDLFEAICDVLMLVGHPEHRYGQ